MPREYGKVVVGTAIDDTTDTSTLLASATLGGGGGGGGDVEAPMPIGSAVPVYSELYYNTQRPGVYGTYPAAGNSTGVGEVYGEPGEDCAQLACFFSWIPLVGFANCFLHADAPPQSRREFWAYRSCLVSSVTTIILIVFFSSYYSSNQVGGRKH